MRLLYVIDSLAPGGAETSLAEMAPGLAAGGVELHVLPLGDRLDLAPNLERAGAHVHVRAPRGGRVGNIRSVIEVSRSVRPQLVHTTLYEADVAGRVAARLLSIPSSSSIVNDSYGPSHYAESNAAKLHSARALDAATARLAQRFHAISRAIADSVPPRLGIPRDKVEVVPRGRDPQRFPFQAQGVRYKVRKELQIAQESPVVLALSRLEPQKGLHYLLQALAEVTKIHPAVVVVFAGRDGRAAQALRCEAAKLPCDIRFLGHRTDVADLLAASDLLCFPSEREGFGGVLIEAMAVGCPIVASSLPTTLEVLGTGESGVGRMTPAGDAVRLGKAINRALSDRRGTAARARMGRARFEELFTTDRVAARMLDFFAHVTRTGPPQSSLQ